MAVTAPPICAQCPMPSFVEVVANSISIVISTGIRYFALTPIGMNSMYSFSLGLYIANSVSIPYIAPDAPTIG